MTLTTLDPRTALVLVDLQRGIVDRPPDAPLAHPIEAVLEQNARLASAFRAAGLPVVLVNVTGGAPGRTDQNPGGGRREIPAAATEIAPELDPRPTDIRVTKQTWGAFHGTDLALRLADEQVTQVVVTGVATSIGVESTARSAYEHGLNVVLATDAMTDMDPVCHDHSVARIFPRLGQVATTDEVLALVPARA